MNNEWNSLYENNTKSNYKIKALILQADSSLLSRDQAVRKSKFPFVLTSRLAKQ